MLIILTRPPKLFFKGSGIYWLKLMARKLLGKVRGPEGVLRSLARGLNEIGQPFSINKKPSAGDTVHVISNIEALRYAIKEKRAGRIGKLIAGPNLVVMPDEYDRILASPEINIVLTVSPWVQNLYDIVLPEIKSKTHIWPSGVQIPNLLHDKKIPANFSCILFIKNAPAEIAVHVAETLDANNIRFETFSYGEFKQQEYFDALTKVDFLVYLQEFESQGIALQEAWAYNIPTLVWNKGIYKSPKGHDIVGNVAAPFLVPETGMLFGKVPPAMTELPFESALTSFIQKIKSPHPFTPRTYCEAHLSDKASAKLYIDII
jgi:hypothetical protein